MKDAARVILLWPLLGSSAVTGGIALLVKPGLLRRGTPLYRWVYWRWFAGETGQAELLLTPHEVRLYAVGLTGVGVAILAAL